MMAKSALSTLIRKFPAMVKILNETIEADVDEDELDIESVAYDLVESFSLSNSPI